MNDDNATLIEFYKAGVETGRKNGIKEVVHWVNNEWYPSGDKWEEQLKEWGIHP
ncbi:hypothetical protein LCGC14_1437060 [marine sediment metagenome]|uniref:Uncharacterized protein n=1 Tax=marine sediment metagenome TaxID=412755 RepID=A0A0F9K838_9ZZZZ